jgi:hypothetical protein
VDFQENPVKIAHDGVLDLLKRAVEMLQSRIEQS